MTSHSGPARSSLADSLDQTRQRLRVREPADLLALIPYLLGFRPRESLVALLTRDKAVALTLRMDLPGALDVESAGAEIAERLAVVAAEQRAETVSLVGYGVDLLQVQRVLAATVDGLSHTSGLELLDAYFADGSRWWSLTCTQTCCPLEGTPYDNDTHEYAAEAVFSGMTAVPDRDDLRSWVQGPDPDDLPHLRSVLARSVIGWADFDDPASRHAAMPSVVEDSLGRGVIDDLTCARLSMLAVEVSVRDLAWSMMTRKNAEQHLALWRSVVSRVVPELSAAPLGLMGMAAWISGNGALQNLCGERLGEIHPGYSLGSLLLDLSDRAVPPSAWMEMQPSRSPRKRGAPRKRRSR